MKKDDAKVWNPNEGDCLQGDVILFKVPSDLVIDRSMEIEPRQNGQLVLAEGEITGHHHAIWLREPVMFRDDALARDVATVAPPVAASAKMWKDDKAVQELVNRGELTIPRLAIGFLEVTGDFMTLRHDEHQAIKIPPGLYYVGNQREFDAAEERRVRD